MKNYKAKILCLSWAAIFTACNAIEEKKNDLARSVTETALEKVTGVSDIDIADESHADKNEVIVDVIVNGKNLKENFKTAFGAVTANQEGLAITVTQEAENTTYSLLCGFTGKNLAGFKPLKGSLQTDNDEQIKFQFSLMRMTSIGMETKMSQEAYGEIMKLSDEEVIVKVSGKLALPENFETPGKWESYSGVVTIKYPVYTSIGISKSDLNY